jgi:hypothetical protein
MQSMNPQQQNQVPLNQNQQSAEPQQVSQTSVSDQLASKAYTKVKVSAYILIASAILGIVLLPASYSYTEQETSLSTPLILTMVIISALVQLWLIVLAVKLFKREYVIDVLSSVKRRFLTFLPLILSLLFVNQWSKFANLVAFVFILFAIMNLKKAGVISR